MRRSQRSMIDRRFRSMQNSLDLPFHQGCCYIDLVKAWSSSNIVTPHPSPAQASRHNYGWWRKPLKCNVAHRVFSHPWERGWKRDLKTRVFLKTCRQTTGTCKILVKVLILRRIDYFDILFWCVLKVFLECSWKWNICHGRSPLPWLHKAFISGRYRGFTSLLDM